jgi:threonine dehydratase
VIAPSIETIRQAALRLAPYVRRTPTIEVELAGRRVMCKLEQLQHGGSFKIRGALNRLLLAPRESLQAGVVTASGGNHGVGVALAAARLGVPAVVYVPVRAPEATVRRIEQTGARCLRVGEAWDDAWAAAEADAARRGATTVHPFEDAAVIAGQGTVGLELFTDAPDADGVIVAVGGGGLVAGVAIAAHAVGPDIAVIGVEPTGAPSMHASLAAGGVVKLPRVDTIAGTLAPRAVGPLTHAISAEHVREIVLVSDDELRAAVRLLWDELRLLVEPAAGASVAALLSGRMKTTLARPALVICGANPDDAEARRGIGAG